MQIEGAGESVHPRVCWHPHKQVIMNLCFISSKICPLKCSKVVLNCAFSPYFPRFLVLLVFIVDQQELLYRKF